jgi:hypothetical protein
MRRRAIHTPPGVLLMHHYIEYSVAGFTQPVLDGIESLSPMSTEVDRDKGDAAYRQRLAYFYGEKNAWTLDHSVAHTRAYIAPCSL